MLDVRRWMLDVRRKAPRPSPPPPPTNSLDQHLPAVPRPLASPPFHSCQPAPLLFTPTSNPCSSPRPTSKNDSANSVPRFAPSTAMKKSRSSPSSTGPSSSPPTSSATSPTPSASTACASPATATKPSPPAKPRILGNLSLDIANRHVLIIDDILDTGKTLSVVVNMIRKLDPASVRTCVLLDKRGRREVEFEADFVGFQIPDKFVVGYGLDFAERYRNLPCIGVLKPHLQNPPEWA
ncbi:hypothetical protein Ga0100230_017260 [Opitutaceae bacterium TAV3]|nr:hypothetical protein Ga0100230_017260 [Opitutaceae bacterium TAV3]